MLWTTQRLRDVYTVAESNFTIKPVQPRRTNRYAVFFTHPRETITFNYERIPADPCISHTLTLAVDEYGNVLKLAAVAQRRKPAFNEQSKSLAAMYESQYTNAILEGDAFRTPLPAEVETYELSAHAQGCEALEFLPTSTPSQPRRAKSSTKRRQIRSKQRSV